MVEFEIETSSFLRGLEELMEQVEEQVSGCSWGDGSDPNLEQSLIENVKGRIFNNSFQLETSLEGWRLDTFNKVGGPETLRNLWLRLKNMEQVIGVKRKISETISDCSSNDSIPRGKKDKMEELLNVSVNPENVNYWCEEVFSLFEKLDIEHGWGGVHKR